jgi:hypothetical protein
MNSYILYDTISATIVVGGQARIRLKASQNSIKHSGQ